MKIYTFLNLLISAQLVLLYSILPVLVFTGYKPRIRSAHHEPVEAKPPYRMGGNSCLAGDFTGFWSFGRELKQGDQIIFEDMIHL